MMKRFVKNGKYLGLLLMVGLLFAGCGTGTSSSEGTVPADSQTGVNSIPVTYDHGQLLIGDAEQNAPKLFDVTLGNGDTVRLEVGNAAACVGQADGALCKVYLKNLDSKYYLANVTIFTHSAAMPTATIDNTDSNNWSVAGGVIVPGARTHAEGMAGYTGVSNAINGSGTTYVEDGQYLTALQPFNVWGATTHECTTGSYKPKQIIFPDCGKAISLFDFGSSGALTYKFSFTVDADYFPWLPVGADKLQGGADDDARYDFTDRTTYYVMLNDLRDRLKDKAAPKAQYKKYRLGGYKRSYTLAGWCGSQGGTGSSCIGPLLEGNINNPSKASLALNRYIGVSVAAELPNRLESRTWGNVNLFTNYEYYVAWAYVLRFNPAVLQLVANSVTTPGGTVLPGGIQLECDAVNGGCSGLDRTNTGYGFDVTSASATNGWIAVMVSSDKAFSFLGYGAKYYSTYGKKRTLTSYATNFPDFFAQKGVAHINTRQTTADPLAKADLNSELHQEGADQDPDMPLAMTHFRVIGTSGTGSEVWIDQFGGWNPFMAWTNGTFTGDGGGRPNGGLDFATSDDWIGYCWPFNPTKMNNTDKGCPSPAPTPLIGPAEGERSNPNILHTGKAVPGYGGYQNWSVHVCVN